MVREPAPRQAYDPKRIKAACRQNRAIHVWIHTRIGQRFWGSSGTLFDTRVPVPGYPGNASGCTATRI
eukprot:213265-Rhodomonas_salina.4